MELAEAALKVLAAQGEYSDAGWRLNTKMPDGLDLEIICAGPDLPVTIPAETVFPADIPKEPDWFGTYRLKVAAPLVALEITWRNNNPLRIIMFSRGDWEAELISLAGRNS